MAYCFIISSNIDFVNSVNKFVEKCSYFKPVKILLRNTVYTRWTELYKCISEKFAATPFADLRESVVLAEEYFDIRKSNPVEDNVDAHVFWGRMILSFPELEFLFLNKPIEDSRNIIEWIESETKTSKNVPFVPFFDYTGIRSKIKENCNSGLVLRKEIARIIEDEYAYAYFHAYIAYKRNYLCKLHNTLNHLEQEKESGKNENVQLQIQDLSLGFIDKREDKNLLDLAKRFEDYKFLNLKPSKDFIITIGQHSHLKKSKDNFFFKGHQYAVIEKANKYGNSIVLREAGKNIDFIYFGASENGSNSQVCPICGLKMDVVSTLQKGPRILYKPTKGMFDIEKQLQLVSDLPKLSASNNGHSAPGVLAFLAENLIARAQQILDNAKQVVDAIHAATLALEAKELLNGLTPTLAFQAFTLQQNAEVMAECFFAGTEYNIDLEPRFKDIKKEVEFIAKRFAESERDRVQLNVQLKIVEILSGVYGNYKQFEEELECLNKARNLHFKKLKCKIFVQPLLLLSWAMKNLLNFGIVLFSIQIFFAFWYYLFLKWYKKTWELDISWKGFCLEVGIILNSLLASIKYFFTSETSKAFENVFESGEPLSNILLGFQGFCSLSSLTIFMAIIYLRFSRK